MANNIAEPAQRIVAEDGVPPDIAHLELPRLEMAELLTQTGRCACSIMPGCTSD